MKWVAQSSSLTWGFHKNLHFINYYFSTFHSDIKSYLFPFSELFTRASRVTSFGFFKNSVDIFVDQLLVAFCDWLHRVRDCATVL